MVDGIYRYVAGDALRTVGSVGALWAHHTHGGGLDSTNVDSVAADLRAAIAQHTGITMTDSDHRVCFDAIAERLAHGFDSLSDDQLSAVISSVWANLSRLRDGSSTSSGTVTSLHVSRGGVPKKGVDTIDINIDGIAGDKQANRTHHGRPWQAVCVWSRDIVDSFASAGHPIEAGFAGENVSVTGLDWSLVRPGTVMEIGSATVRVTAFSIPCKKNASWFADRDFMAMSHERGWVSRVYALVLRPGRAAVGDRVTLRH